MPKDSWRNLGEQLDRALPDEVDAATARPLWHAGDRARPRHGRRRRRAPNDLYDARAGKFSITFAPFGDAKTRASTCADAPDTKTPNAYGVCSTGLTQSPQYTDLRRSYSCGP